MALDFPNSPTTGQQFNPAGSNTVWQYDGTKWLPIGKSIMPMGVTDGSNAAAGQVGEFLTVNSPVNIAGLPVGSWFTSASMALSLTAGDWDVWGLAQFGTPATVLYNQISAGLTSTVNGNPMGTSGYGALIYMNNTVISGGSLPIVQTRFSFSATTLVYICYSASGFSGAALVGGTIMARRAR